MLKIGHGFGQPVLLKDFSAHNRTFGLDDI